MVLRARVMMLMLFVSLSLAAEERREVDTRPRRRARGESRVAGDPQLRACALWEEEGSDDPFVLCPAAGVRAACGVRRAACGVRRAACGVDDELPRSPRRNSPHTCVLPLP